MAIGHILRDIRKANHLTGIEVARRMGCSQSQISKIENGLSTTLDTAETEKLLTVLKASPADRRKVLALLHQSRPATLSSMAYKPLWTQSKGYELERQTTQLRMYIWGLVPALLQTVDYRRAIMKDYGLTEQETLGHLKYLSMRQELLWDKDRHFHLIIHESTLYGQPGTRRVQQVQLDKLERSIGQPNIKLGIIPFMSRLPAVDGSSFVVYDDHTVAVPTVGADMISKDVEAILNHAKAFNEYHEHACYGDEARALLHRAIDHFS